LLSAGDKSQSETGDNADQNPHRNVLKDQPQYQASRETTEQAVKELVAVP
jgi:hypothetical protein